MKKITYFFAFLLISLFSVNASAQETAWLVDPEINLIKSVSQLYSPQVIADTQRIGDTEVADTETDVINGWLIDGQTDHYWHTCWWSNDAIGTHYLEVEFTDPELPSLPERFGFTFTRRNNNGNQITKWGVYSAPSREATKAECTLIAVVETPFTSAQETLTSPVLNNTNGANRLRFYCEGPAYFFHMSEFAVNPCKEVPAEEAALKDLIATYGSYSGYKDTYASMVGDVPGTYGTAEYNAFVAALDATMSAIDGENAGTLSAAELRQLAADIVSTYDAFIASYKKYIPADGYYFIKNNLDFTDTVVIEEATEDTEDEETGEIIPGHDAITETQHVVKAMYANGTNLSWKTLNEEDCTFLWKITYDEEHDAFQIYNVATDARFNQIAQSAAATLSVDADPVASEVTLTPQMTDENGTVIAIRRADQTGAYQFAHCGGHGGGAGKSGNIVGWSSDADASRWRIVAVSDEVAAALIEAYEPIKNHDKLVENYNSMKNAANTALEIARDNAKESVIKSVSQLTFHVTEPTEGSEAAIIDNNPNTYWHSVWSSEPDGAPYIIVDCEEAIKDFTWSILRRKCSNDHVNLINLYGSNNGEDFVEAVMAMEVGNASNGQAFETEVSLPEAYRYIKFETAGCAGSTCGVEGAFYTHYAEFQLLKSSAPKEHTQYELLGELATNLEAVLAQQAEIASADITIETYNTLKAVYDAFMEKYVDPTELRELLASTKDAAAGVVIGTNPGEWADNGSIAAFNTAYAAAVAYDEASAYTQELSAQHIENVKNAADGISGAANKVVPGKWYALRYGSRELYEANGWPTAPGTNENLGDMFDNSIAPANLADNNLEAVDGIQAGQALRFVDQTVPNGLEETAFCFVPVEGDTYAIKHSSGLFIGLDGSGMNLSLKPALFDVKAVGYGRNIIHVTNIAGEEVANGGDVTYLHAQNAGHLLVHWAADAVNSNSALAIVDITDQMDESSIAGATLTISPNGMQIWTLPVSYSLEGAKIYEMQGKKVNEAANTVSICLNEVATAEGGKPYLIVAGDPANQDDEDEGTETTFFSIPEAPVFAAEAGSTNGMIGTYSYAWPCDDDDEVAAALAVVRAREHFANYFGYTFCTQASTDKDGQHVYDSNGNEGRDVSAYTGYVDLREAPVVEGTFDLEIEVVGADATTAVQKVVAELSTVGNIYTVDGKFIGTGTLNTVKTLGRGVYVVNGVKVAVK